MLFSLETAMYNSYVLFGPALELAERYFIWQRGKQLLLSIA